MHTSTLLTAEMANVHFESRKSYDYFRIAGDMLNYDVFMGRLRAIARTRDTRKRNVILVENNYIENLSQTDLFRVITGLPEIGIFGSRLAIANSTPTNNDDNDFANTVAQNRAIPIRVFSSVGAAEQWLSS